MLSDLDRRILARACNFCLHEKCEHVLIKNDKAQCKVCGEWTKVKWDENGFYFPNPTFTTPDDWELVRQNVVVPNFYEITKDIDARSLIIALVMQTPQMMCLFILNWIKSRPDLFPWITEMLKEEV